MAFYQPFNEVIYDQKNNLTYANLDQLFYGYGALYSGQYRDTEISLEFNLGSKYKFTLDTDNG